MSNNEIPFDFKNIRDQITIEDTVMLGPQEVLARSLYKEKPYPKENLVSLGLPKDQRDKLDAPAVVIHDQILEFMSLIKNDKMAEDLETGSLSRHEAGADVYGYRWKDPNTGKVWSEVVGILPKSLDHPSSPNHKSLQSTPPIFEDRKYIEAHAPYLLPHFDFLFEEFKKDDPDKEIVVLGSFHTHDDHPVGPSGVDTSNIFAWFRNAGVESIHLIASSYWSTRYPGKNPIIGCWYASPANMSKNLGGFDVLRTSGKEISPYLFDISLMESINSDEFDESNYVRYGAERDLFQSSEMDQESDLSELEMVELNIQEYQRYLSRFITESFNHENPLTPIAIDVLVNVLPSESNLLPILMAYKHRNPQIVSSVQLDNQERQKLHLQLRQFFTRTNFPDTVRHTFDFQYRNYLSQAKSE